MGSNPSRVIPLLGIAHPVEGILFQVQGELGRRHSLEAVLRRKPTCGFGMDYVKLVLNS